MGALPDRVSAALSPGLWTEFNRDDSGQVYSTGNSGHRDIRLSAKLEAGMTSLHTNLYGDVSSASPAMGSYILGWLRSTDTI